MKPGDILRKLVKHPEVIRRRKLYQETVHQNSKAVIVDTYGWHTTDSCAFWLTEQGRLDLLSDFECGAKCAKFVSDTTPCVINLS